MGNSTTHPRWLLAPALAIAVVLAVVMPAAGDAPITIGAEATTTDPHGGEVIVPVTVAGDCCLLAPGGVAPLTVVVIQSRGPHTVTGYGDFNVPYTGPGTSTTFDVLVTVAGEGRFHHGRADAQVIQASHGGVATLASSEIRIVRGR